MFLDGMCDLPSGLLPEKCSGNDHAERNPLNRIEQLAERVIEECRLTKEREQKLCNTAQSQGEGKGISHSPAYRELSK
jgi:hypothetical protein